MSYMVSLRNREQQGEQRRLRRRQRPRCGLAEVQYAPRQAALAAFIDSGLPSYRGQRHFPGVSRITSLDSLLVSHDVVGATAGYGTGPR